jgi:hypothetical protein
MEGRRGCTFMSVSPPGPRWGNLAWTWSTIAEKVARVFSIGFNHGRRNNSSGRITQIQDGVSEELELLERVRILHRMRLKGREHRIYQLHAVRYDLLKRGR